MKNRLSYFEDHGSQLKRYSLIMAAYYEREETAEKLIKNDPDQINLQDPYGGLTALHVAIFRQNSRIVELLIMCPEIDVTIKDNFGRTIVDMLDYNSDQRVFDLVIDKCYADEMKALEDEAYEEGIADNTIVPLKPNGP